MPYILEPSRCRVDLLSLQWTHLSSLQVHRNLAVGYIEVISMALTTHTHTVIITCKDAPIRRLTIKQQMNITDTVPSSRNNTDLVQIGVSVKNKAHTLIKACCSELTLP